MRELFEKKKLKKMSCLIPRGTSGSVFQTCLPVSTENSSHSGVHCRYLGCSSLPGQMMLSSLLDNKVLFTG
jgi:hypothetical protein